MRNRAESGGGVYSAAHPYYPDPEDRVLIKMKGASRITRNTADGGIGGGILSEGTVRFSRWWHGPVCGNTPDDWRWCTP